MPGVVFQIGNVEQPITRFNPLGTTRKLLSIETLIFPIGFVHITFIAKCD